MSAGSVGKSIGRLLQPASSPWSSPVASTSRLVVTPNVACCRALRRFEACSTQLTAGFQQKRYSSHPTAKAGITRKKRTIMDLNSLKRKGVPLTMLTAHDYPSARFIENSASPLPPSESYYNAPPRGIDICLVGDSLAMVACGYTSTTSLTLEEMLYHCRSVARGCKTSLLVSDMPFGSFYASTSQAVTNAIRIMQEGNMDAVKIEGGIEIVDIVRKLSSMGLPVMGHVGLTPQRQAALSGYRVQGKTVESALAIFRDAKAIEEAGAFAVLLEAIPSRLASFITSKLSVPTIGIGAGAGCSGQVLVNLDMLGVNSMEKSPKFVKRYADLENIATKAIESYVIDVRSGSFPEEKHGYAMEDAEWDGFMEAVAKETPSSL